MGTAGTRCATRPRAWVTFALLACAACDGGPSRPRDAYVDAPEPDLPPILLDQQPLLPDGAGGDGSRRDATDGPRRDSSGPPATLSAPFLLDFEASAGGLVGTRDWEWGKYLFKAGTNCDTTSYYPPSGARSGTHMWGTKLNDCYSPLNNGSTACANATTSDDSVLSVRVKIPSAATAASLSYWEWADYFLDFDWTEVRIDNQVVKQVCTSGALPTPPVWTKQTIDLKTHIGKTITIAFHFMASGVINHSGWYIDDLAVSSQ